MRLRHRPLCGLCLIIAVIFSLLILIMGEKWVPGLKKSSLERHWSEGDSITVTGTVYDIGKGETYQKIYLKDVILQNQKINSTYTESKLLVYVQKDIPLLGNIVKVNGTVSFFQEARNPGNFDAKSYYQKQNIHGMVYCSKMSVLADVYGNIQDNQEKLENDFSEQISEKKTGIWGDALNTIRSSWWKVKRMLRVFRNQWQENLLQVMGNTDGSILSAMLLGEKSGMDQEIKDIYQANGIAHILAISSLHLMFVGGNIYRGLRRMTGSYTIGGILGSMLLGLYILMVGFTISAVRALVMFMFQVGAAMCGRKYDVPTAYVAAFLLVLIWRPLSLYDGGFWMSFGAVFAVLFVAPLMFGQANGKTQREQKINSKNEKGKNEKNANLRKERDEKKREEIRNNIKESVGVSLSIQLVMLPILLYYYYEISPLSLILNLIVIPLMSVLLACGMIGSLFLIIMKPIGILMLWACKGILWIYHYGGEKALCIPGNRWVIGQPKQWQIIIYYICLTIILFWVWISREHNEENSKAENRDSSEVSQAKNSDGQESYQAEKKSRRFVDQKVKRKHRMIVLIRSMILMVALFILVIHPEEYNRLRITFIDVGQGDSIFIRSPDGLCMLMDGGSSDVSDVGRYRIEPYLKSIGVGRLDYVFVSHGDADHISGIEEMISRQNVGVHIDNMVFPEKEYWDDTLKSLAKEAAASGIRVLAFSQGKKIREELKITCLAPGVCDNLENVNMSESKSIESKGLEAGNEASMVLAVSCGEIDILLTGDVEDEGEDQLTKILQNNYNQITWEILKVAHHGSKNSSDDDFLNAVHPKEAIISAGINNRYGHPHEETLDRLKSVGSIIRTTQDVGGIEYLLKIR